MAITLNAPAEHTFAEPLGLMSDCHRRVEQFLGVILALAESAHGGPLDAEQSAALEKALRYFRSAAPMHTADEEESLFPRMRACGGPEIETALAQIAGLEADHKVAEEAHRVVDELASRWLRDDHLDAEDSANLRKQAISLREIYGQHIALEDDVIFPLAGRTLDAEALAEVGREMAARRGVDPDIPSPMGRCASRRLAREAGSDLL